MATNKESKAAVSDDAPEVKDDAPSSEKGVKKTKKARKAPRKVAGPANDAPKKTTASVTKKVTTAKSTTAKKSAAPKKKKGSDDRHNEIMSVLEIITKRMVGDEDSRKVLLDRLEEQRLVQSKLSDALSRAHQEQQRLSRRVVETEMERKELIRRLSEVEDKASETQEMVHSTALVALSREREQEELMHRTNNRSFITGMLVTAVAMLLVFWLGWILSDSADYKWFGVSANDQKVSAHVVEAIEPSAGIKSDTLDLDAAAAALLESEEGAQKASNMKMQLPPDTTLPENMKDLEKQSYAGVAEAQHNLAALYASGSNGVEQDYARALLWFHEAAEGGITNAWYNLGVMYHQGLAVEPDLSKALDYYQKAARDDHPEAQYNLGIAAIEGDSDKYDPVKAEEYFKGASEGGVTEAAYNLGLLYENGLLGAPKMDEAVKWYKNAAAQGNTEAQMALENLSRRYGFDLNDAADAEPMLVGAEADAIAAALNQLEPSAAEASAQDRLLIARIQKQLARLGLYDGDVDGLSNDDTKSAIRSFQTEQKLTINGSVSNDLLKTLKNAP